MIVIGERINGTRKRVHKAVIERDAAHIEEEAKLQAEAGADYIDVNAGTTPDREPEDLVWLVKTVQEAVALPCCIDTPNPVAMAAALEAHKGQPIINSITGESERIAAVLPLVVAHKAKVVALTMDDTGMPSTRDARRDIATAIVKKANAAGVPVTDMLVDPLIRPVSSEPDQVRAILEATAAIKEDHPGIKTCYGLSNISFGLPNRHLLNRTFLAMAMAFGLDGALVDPLDAKFMSILVAARALTGQDEYCVEYLTAHRKGQLE